VLPTAGADHVLGRDATADRRGADLCTDWSCSAERNRSSSPAGSGRPPRRSSR